VPGGFCCCAGWFIELFLRNGAGSGAAARNPGRYPIAAQILRESWPGELVGLQCPPVTSLDRRRLAGRRVFSPPRRKRRGGAA
jgi:hypothetical protein